MLKFSLSFPIILLLCLACTKETDLPYPSAEPQIVLNGLLHPDSIITIELARTLPLQSDTLAFPFIDNATVELYEDASLLGIMEPLDSGKYKFEYHPQPGKYYSVKAHIPGEETVSASDFVPVKPSLNACYSEGSDYPFTNLSMEIQIIDPKTENNYYWMELAIRNYKQNIGRCQWKDSMIVCGDQFDSTIIVNKKIYNFFSRSTVPDKFNANFDNTSNGFYQYESYMRIDDLALQQQNVKIDLAAYDYLLDYYKITKLTQDQSVLLNVISASQTYDRYMKSSLIQFLNYNAHETPNPFVQPTQIYSNIENGTGIFAAYNSVSIEIEDFPCE